MEISSERNQKRNLDLGSSIDCWEASEFRTRAMGVLDAVAQDEWVNRQCFDIWAAGFDSGIAAMVQNVFWGGRYTPTQITVFQNYVNDMTAISTSKKEEPNG